MKKDIKDAVITVVIILGIILLCFTDSFSQPFVGLNLTQKGIGVNTGFLINNVEITANYKPLTNKQDVPKVLSLSAGYRCLLTFNEINNWSITPSVGVGNYRVKDFRDYDADPTGKTGIKQISKYEPIYGINLSKDSWIGQGFVSVDYCNKIVFYGIGIRAYFYRKLIN